MDNELISVIIPVYNVERYLSKCIESILAQTYKNIEIILVDDGSKDKSPKICDKYAKKDNRITVIHKENAGVSVARNEGIEKAKGDYICFIDSDDFIPNDSIEKLLNALDSDDVDLCCGAWAKITIKSTTYNRYDNRIIDTRDKLDLIDYMQTEEVNGPVAKLYKTDIIKHNKIEFIPGILIGEDAIFNYQYIRKCKKVKLIGDTVYFYNKMNAGSVTHAFYEDFNKCSLMCADEQAKNIINSEYEEFSSNVQNIYKNRFYSSINYILFYDLSAEKTKEKLIETFKLFENHFAPNDETDDLDKILMLCKNAEVEKLREHFNCYSASNGGIKRKLKLKLQQLAAEIKIIKIYHH